MINKKMHILKNPILTEHSKILQINLKLNKNTLIN